METACPRALCSRIREDGSRDSYLFLVITEGQTERPPHAERAAAIAVTHRSHTAGGECEPRGGCPPEADGEIHHSLPPCWAPNTRLE